MPATIDPRKSLKAQLAYTIKVLRELRGLSQEQLAKELIVSRESISSYESARNRPDDALCEKLDAFFNTGEMLRSLGYHGQYQHHREWAEEYVEHEKTSAEVRNYEPNNIPGLLQTEEYMWVGVRPTPDNEERMARRRSRKEILERQQPPEFWVVIDEAVIRRPVGGPHIMAEQLNHLLVIGEMENVTIQVVPETVGRYPGLNGSLVVFDKPDGSLVGYVEAQLGGRLIEESAEARSLGVRFNRIRASALSESDSRTLIRRTMERWNHARVAEK